MGGVNLDERWPLFTPEGREFLDKLDKILLSADGSQSVSEEGALLLELLLSKDFARRHEDDFANWMRAVGERMDSNAP